MSRSSAAHMPGSTRRSRGARRYFLKYSKPAIFGSGASHAQRRSGERRDQYRQGLSAVSERGRCGARGRWVVDARPRRRRAQGLDILSHPQARAIDCHHERSGRVLGPIRQDFAGLAAAVDTSTATTESKAHVVPRGRRARRLASDLLSRRHGSSSRRRDHTGARLYYKGML